MLCHLNHSGGMTELKKTERRKVLAKWLKETILRLGPTFIKIGQQFSTRVDILSKEYIDELSKLQVSYHNSRYSITFYLILIFNSGAFSSTILSVLKCFILNPYSVQSIFVL